MNLDLILSLLSPTDADDDMRQDALTYIAQSKKNLSSKIQKMVNMETIEGSSNATSIIANYKFYLDYLNCLKCIGKVLTSTQLKPDLLVFHLPFAIVPVRIKALAADVQYGAQISRTLKKDTSPPQSVARLRTRSIFGAFIPVGILRNKLTKIQGGRYAWIFFGTGIQFRYCLRL